MPPLGGGVIRGLGLDLLKLGKVVDGRRGVVVVVEVIRHYVVVGYGEADGEVVVAGLAVVEGNLVGQVDDVLPRGGAVGRDEVPRVEAYAEDVCGALRRELGERADHLGRGRRYVCGGLGFLGDDDDRAADGDLVRVAAGVEVVAQDDDEGARVDEVRRNSAGSLVRSQHPASLEECDVEHKGPV